MFLDQNIFDLSFGFFLKSSIWYLTFIVYQLIWYDMVNDIIWYSISPVCDLNSIFPMIPLYSFFYMICHQCEPDMVSFLWYFLVFIYILHSDIYIRYGLSPVWFSYIIVSFLWYFFDYFNSALIWCYSSMVYSSMFFFIFIIPILELYCNFFYK